MTTTNRKSRYFIQQSKPHQYRSKSTPPCRCQYKSQKIQPKTQSLFTIGNITDKPQLPEPRPVTIKLSQSQPQYKKTCIVLDWDDTIFPSTHILNLYPTLEIPVNIDFTMTKVYEELHILEDIILNKVVELCLIADVFIVTNSLQGWVESISRKFCPRLWDCVCTIPILSARSMYEHAFPKDSYMWKYFAIQSCINVKYHTRFVSLGDSPEDKTVSTSISTILGLDFQFVQFDRHPNIQTLINQWKQINIQI